MAKIARIAVIGGGWSGLAAAVRLAEAGAKVTVFEASRVLGGRARRQARPFPVISTTIEQEAQSVDVDNGQHLLIGAYRECLALMRVVGVDPAEAFLRLPLQLPYPDGFSFQAVRRLPAPWHLLAGLAGVRGLGPADKIAMAAKLNLARLRRWTLPEADVNTLSVDAWLARKPFAQSATARARIWEPLCVAALNTPPAHASAQTFLHVLRDSLGGTRAASDMLLPRRDLSALFPEPAARYVTDREGEVRLGARISALAGDEYRWEVGRASFHGLVLATPPADTAALLATLAPPNSFGFDVEPELQSRLKAITTHGIITVTMLYPGVRLDRPFYALPPGSGPGHFVFDLGWLDASKQGLLSVVIGATSPSDEELDQADTPAGLVPHLHNQLAILFRWPAGQAPLRSRAVHEKRATFRCTPDLDLPETALQLAGKPPIVLAGDHVRGDPQTRYPATLETAVRNGTAAADRLIADVRFHGVLTPRPKVRRVGRAGARAPAREAGKDRGG